MRHSQVFVYFSRRHGFFLGLERTQGQQDMQNRALKSRKVASHRNILEFYKKYEQGHPSCR